ncbi:MAG: LmeA family phospholipid-binding protein [Elusimicrobia bacterium]|nr:LmeA family phospholipid-binding protein [Elusimicrobiota bacterium]
MSRRALIDFPLTALVTAGWAALVASDGFTQRRASLLFGLVSGWGCLTKPTFAFFVFPAAAWIAIRSWRSAYRERPSIRWNLIMATLLVLGIAAPWYTQHLAKFIKGHFRVETVLGPAEGDPSILSRASWAYYALALPHQMGKILSLLATLGFVASAVFKRREDRWPLVWMISGYVGLTLLRNKDYRYTLPYLPALALILSAWIWRLRGARIWAGLAGLAAMGQVVYASVVRDPPQQEDWKHRELLHTMAAWHDPREPQLLCAVLNNHPMLFGGTLRWTAKTLGIPMETTGIGDDPGEFAEFVLLKTGDIGPASEELATIAQKLLNSGRSFSEVYRLITTVPLPDGSTGRLFHREPLVFQIPDLSVRALEHRLEALLSGAFHIQSQEPPQPQNNVGPLSVRVKTTADELQRGRLRSVVIEGRSLLVKKTPIASCRLELEDVWLNLYRLWDKEELAILSVGTLHPTIQVSLAELTQRLEGKVKGLDSLKVYGQGAAWTIEGRYRGVSVVVHGSGRLIPETEQMVWRVERADIAGWPLPAFLLGDYRQQRVPLVPTPSFPMALQIRHIQITKDHLLIS